MNKNMIIALIAVIVVGAGAFFGGMKYDQAQRPSQQPGQGNGGFARRFGNGQNGQAVRGQVISNDNGTLTVKMRDGSTKLVILSGSTMVTKATTGSKDDIKPNTQVMVFGTNNSDGSVTAQVIQLNPMFGPSGTPAAR